MRGASFIGSFSAITLVAASAVAQTAPPGSAPAQPAPPAQPPAAAPAQTAAPQAPPPGYPPQGAYPGYPPGSYPAPAPAPAKPPPKYLAFHAGKSIPAGYHHDTRLRKGPLIAGAVVLGVPYVLGAAIAAGGNYANKSAFLLIPAVGPWLTLGIRDHSCAPDDAGCDASEAVARTFLVLDAIMQTTGTAFLIWGIADQKDVLVRDDVVFSVAPTKIGSGYGVGLFGSF
jgi:hypothetical protein